MAKIFKVGTGGLPLIPPGDYEAKFVEWTLKNTQFGESVELRYSITSGEHAGTVVSALCKADIKPKTKLGIFTADMLGEPLEPNSEIDLDAILGAEGVVTTETVRGKLGDYSKVTKFTKK